MVALYLIGVGVAYLFGPKREKETSNLPGADPSARRLALSRRPHHALGVDQDEQSRRLDRDPRPRGAPSARLRTPCGRRPPRPTPRTRAAGRAASAAVLERERARRTAVPEWMFGDVDHLVERGREHRPCTQPGGPRRACRTRRARTRAAAATPSRSAARAGCRARASRRTGRRRAAASGARMPP
jgi:hypothetical protein